MVKTRSLARAAVLACASMLALATAGAAPSGNKPAPPPAPAPAPVPAPAPAPPTPADGSGSGSAAHNGTDEKAGTNETLQNGGQDRPWATGVSDSERTTALAMFHEGNGYLNDGLFLKASEKYKEALKHWDHPAIHYNLALALLNLDQPIEVYDNLVAATKYGTAPLEKDKFEHAKEYLLLIEKQIAEIEVSCDKPGAKVAVDGVPVFTAPGKYAARVRVGKHTFVAEKEGYQVRGKAPYIGPGEKFRLELKLYTAEDLTRYRRRWNATWIPYAVVGAGVAFGIAGGVLEYAAKRDYDDFDHDVAQCSVNNSGCPTTKGGLSKLKSNGDEKKDLGYVGYGAAAGAIVIGAALAVLNRQQAYEIRPDQIPGESPEEPTVSVTPIVTPTMAGAGVFGHF